MTVVLVEGDSDAAAVETLAERFTDRRDGELVVVSAHGITNFRKLLIRFTDDDADQRVVGLYDEPEEAVVQRALASAGFGRATSRAEIERFGFFACIADLEDELIRALGVDRVEALVEAEGELPAFRILQQQPAQRSRPVAQQLRRFMGTKARRKIRYARLLAAAVDPDRCPEPLRRVISSEPN